MKEKPKMSLNNRLIKVGASLFMVLLAVAAVMLIVAPRTIQAAPATVFNYSVDTSTDAPDTNTADSVCSNGVDGCSLRAAIQQSFSHSPSTITIPGSWDGSTFLLDNTYGTIVWAGSDITVTGNITVSGVNLSAGKSIFQIKGDHNVLQGLTIKSATQDGIQIGDFDGVGFGNNNIVQNVVLIGNAASGVFVRGGGGGGGQANIIRNSWIGTTSSNTTSCVAGQQNAYGLYVALGAAGTIIDSDRIVCNTIDGISIDGTSGTNNTLSENNYIGTNGYTDMGNGYAGIAIYSGAQRTTSYLDTISGNDRQGIYIAGSTTRYITVTATYIGTDYNGGFAIPNSSGGIYIDTVANANARIGPDNLISGNNGEGVSINSSSVITIAGNKIGTTANGTAALPNGFDGVALTAGTNHTTIGGALAADRNVISGNTLDAVYMNGVGTSYNLIDSNLIGLNVAGTAAIPNGWYGVEIRNGANSNTLGSCCGSVSQFISGNGLDGILIDSANNTLIAQTNNIGVAGNLTTPRGNGGAGVYLTSAISTSVFPSLIAYNGGAGVAVLGSSALRNAIWSGTIRNNTGLPIDLGNDGQTPNDPGDADSGPNTLLNYPVITAGSGSVITGTACNNCKVLIYQAIGNPGAPGGGGINITNINANGSGNWSVALPFSLTRADVSLVACESPCGFSANTSEMSPRLRVFLPLVLKNH
jgi:hypothetical protein